MPLLPPPILSVTVIAYESSAFVWIDLATSISSLKKDTQGSCRIFHFAVCRSSFGPTLYGCTISVCHLKKSFFSFHSSAPKRGNLYSWPPTTCAGSKCQNVVKNCSLEVQAAETHATLFRTRSTATPRHGSFATTSIYKVIISFRSFFHTSSGFTVTLCQFLCHQQFVENSRSLSPYSLSFREEDPLQSKCVHQQFLQLSLSTAVITTPQPLHPLSVLLPSR